ncbi:MAG TPA: hypothetical protein VNU01_01710 [Egibacteraceae bacterium]|nr:hypothetical protein [Egibacteraceae bacterium]
MIPPPRSDPDSLDLLADWVELACLLAHSVAVFDVAEEFRVGGVAGIDSDQFLDEPRLDGGALLAEGDEAEDLARQVWAVLNDRRAELRSAYPFKVSEGLVTSEGWRAWPAYAFLLLLDVGRRYGLSLEPGHERRFEKIVEASMTGLLRSRAVRFGTPAEPDWPVPLPDRVRYLATLLDLEANEQRLARHHLREKDIALDVVGLLKLAGQDGGVAVLAQCAVGENWTGKSGEPSLTEWRGLLDWNSVLLKAIAVPWRLPEGVWPHRRVAERFEALVLDRPRLVLGHPDRLLTDAFRDELRAACDSPVAQLRRLQGVAS